MKPSIAELAAKLELMARFGVTHLPHEGGIIVRPIPIEQPKGKVATEDEFERIQRMSVAEQDALFKGLGKR
jgi:hypothetical protein